ncbi:MAG: hypothetical protein CMI16_07355 [Opitutaceae bacterium]|nr:hypothetical protein [Opitutaceae bacterium]
MSRPPTWTLKPEWKSTSFTRIDGGDGVRVRFTHESGTSSVVHAPPVQTSSQAELGTEPQQTTRTEQPFPTEVRAYVRGAPYLGLREPGCTDTMLHGLEARENVRRVCTLKDHTGSAADVATHLHLLHLLYERTPEAELSYREAVLNRPLGDNSGAKRGCLLLSAPPPVLHAADGSRALLVARSARRVHEYGAWLADPDAEEARPLLQRPDVRRAADANGGRPPSKWMRDRATCELADRPDEYVCGALLSSGAVLDRAAVLSADFQVETPLEADLYVAYLDTDRRYVLWNPSTDTEWTHPKAAARALAHYVDHDQRARRSELEGRLQRMLRDRRVPTPVAALRLPPGARELCAAVAAENDANRLRHDRLLSSINAELLLDVTLSSEEYAERARVCEETHEQRNVLLLKLQQAPQLGENPLAEHARLKRAVVECLTTTPRRDQEQGQEQELAPGDLRFDERLVDDALTAHVRSERGDWVSFVPSMLAFEGECPETMPVRLCRKRTLEDVRANPFFVSIPARCFVRCFARDTSTDHQPPLAPSADRWHSLTEEELVCEAALASRRQGPQENPEELDARAESDRLGAPFAEIRTTGEGDEEGGGGGSGGETIALVVETDTDPAWARQ